MTEDNAQQIRLADGRRLAYAEYGDPAGHPVLYCHGFPSSRREALLMHKNACAEHARIVSIDRPGYGDSDFKPKRTIRDWPADLAAVADHLELERFALIGVSGGGPYALACAAAIPERLSACALVCPLGPVFLAEVLDAMHWGPRSQLALARNAPRTSRLLFGPMAAGFLAYWPDTIERMRTLAAPAADRRALQDTAARSALQATIRDAVRDGGRGARQDLLLYTRPWGIAFDTIEIPIQLWHGEADGTVPAAHTRWYAARLPNATATYLPDEGHYSLPLQHSGQILRALLQTAAPRPGTKAFDEHLPQR